MGWNWPENGGQKMYEHVKAYLNNPAQFSELIGQAYKKLEEESKEEVPDPKEMERRKRYHAYEPVNPAWIDEEKTVYMTEVMHKILPKEFPFFTCVTVVKDPEWKQIAEKEEELHKHLRYILVTVVGDEYPSYQANYGIFNMCAAGQLGFWETARSAHAASNIGARIKFVDYETLPSLQEAHVEYVTLYVGEKPFTGSRSFSEHADDCDANLGPVQMAAIRDMTCTPATEGLLAAYEADMKAAGMTEGSTKKNDMCEDISGC